MYIEQNVDSSSSGESVCTLVSELQHKLYNPNQNKRMFLCSPHNFEFQKCSTLKKHLKLIQTIL